MGPKKGTRKTAAAKGTRTRTLKKGTRRSALDDDARSDSSGAFDWNDTGDRDLLEPSIMTRAGTRNSRRGNDGAEMPWVRCDSCRKWRRLEDSSDLSTISSVGAWYCRMNTWDPARATCAAPEEPYPKERRGFAAGKGAKNGRETPTFHQPPRESLSPLEQQEYNRRDLVLAWVRRLRCAEKAEARMPGSVVTRGKRRETGELQWVQCSNPRCGKWRALLRSMDVRSVVPKGQPWYCVMNTWDESVASCSAPQETLVTEERIFGRLRKSKRSANASKAAASERTHSNAH